MSGEILSAQREVLIAYSQSPHGCVGESQQTTLLHQSVHTFRILQGSYNDHVNQESIQLIIKHYPHIMSYYYGIFRTPWLKQSNTLV